MKRLQIPGAAVVGFLLLAGATAQGKQEKPARRQPAQEQKQAKRVRGSKDTADGQIRTVTCRGRTLNMTFDDPHEILPLHTDNYFKVNFSAINFTASGTMNPCKRAGECVCDPAVCALGHPVPGATRRTYLRLPLT